MLGTMVACLVRKSKGLLYARISSSQIKVKIAQGYICMGNINSSDTNHVLHGLSKILLVIALTH
jgi:hypothetical protein